MIALVTLITAMVFLLGYQAIWLLLAISVFRSLGNAIHTPSVGAVYPQIVPKDNLMKVQGLNSGIQSAMMIVSPMIAAALLGLWPLQYIFFIDVVTAILAITTLVMFVPIPSHTNQVEKGTKIDYFADIKLGASYITHHVFLIPFFVYTAVVLFLVAPLAFLTPLQVVRTFGSEVWRLSAIEIAFSLGMTGGGLLIAAWGGFKNRMITMAFSILGMGVAAIFIGVVPNFIVYLSLMAAVGITLPFFNTPAIVMVQEKVEPDYLGRVLSVMGMISASSMPLGMLVFGPLADIISIELILILSGALLTLSGFFLLSNKKLIASGKSSPIESTSNSSL
jgi:DHA3 family macrolide efflux protein-like MFS transporter